MTPSDGADDSASNPLSALNLVGMTWCVSPVQVRPRERHWRQQGPGYCAGSAGTPKGGVPLDLLL
jgi:hypothetical protein